MIGVGATARLLSEWAWQTQVPAYVLNHRSQLEG